MSLRRNVILKSSAFNTSQPKEYFINECCYGDDPARWLISGLKQNAIRVAEDPDRKTSDGISASTSEGYVIA
jgi:hypothetical protein